MNEHVFRAYDIRGVADHDLTDPFVFALGQAFATLVGRDHGRRKIAVGRDCRLSSDRIFRAFSSGLRASGADVVDLRVLASPILYWAAHHFTTDGAVQITGSHNPAEYNGFKMMLGTSTLHGDAIAELKRLVTRGDFASGDGGVIEVEPLGAYVDDIAGRVTVTRPLKVVVDGGNGTGGPPAVALLERLGVEIVPLYVDMDGRFPNHHPDPTVEANLAELRAAVLVHAQPRASSADEVAGDLLERVAGALAGRGQVAQGAAGVGPGRGQGAVLVADQDHGDLGGQLADLLEGVARVG